MNEEPTPSLPSLPGTADTGAGPLARAAQAQLDALVELKDRLQELHAQLEYARLLLKLQNPIR